jgi:hypothetical protein
MRIRVTPSFVVAVLALLVAVGGTGYAAGKINSGDIKDGTIKSRDVKDGALTGVDVKDGSLGTTEVTDGSLTGTDVQDGTLTGADIGDGSLGRGELNRACGPDESHLFGGCVAHASSETNTSYQAAINDCSQRGGRLPTTAELFWIASHVEFEWADGNPSQYEFTGDYTDGAVYTPIAFDRATNDISNASGQLFWHHCVTY